MQKVEDFILGHPIWFTTLVTFGSISLGFGLGKLFIWVFL